MASEKQTWADVPFPLIRETHASSLPSSVPKDHACIAWARDMAQIHNTMIRAFNASYNQCLSIQPGTQEAADFLLFNRLLFNMLDHHHHVEEEFLFPGVEKLLGVPGAMEPNVEQHHAFEKGLGVFEEYVTQTKPEGYCGRQLRDILDSFLDVLVQHLHDEIPTLLNLHTLDSKEMSKIWEKTAHEATKDIDIFTDAPFVLSCQDRTFLLDGQPRGFPGIPFFLPWVVSAIFARRHAGAWKFSPSGILGAPRPLMFAS